MRMLEDPSLEIPTIAGYREGIQWAYLSQYIPFLVANRVGIPLKGAS